MESTSEEEVQRHERGGVNRKGINRQKGSRSPTHRAGREKGCPEHADLPQNLEYSAWDKPSEPSDVHDHMEQGQIPAVPSLPHIIFSPFSYFKTPVEGGIEERRGTGNKDWRAVAEVACVPSCSG